MAELHQTRFRFQVPSSTLQRKYLNTELTPDLIRTHSTAQVNHLDFLRSTHLGPDSLYPWRPDSTHLLTILPFTFQYHFVNKTPFTNSVVLLSVLLYMGQIYLEQNDTYQNMAKMIH
ncbi:hypothetical protein CHARACLAT_012023 [Characodon lateralis]|uniref:Uncharacterized protein n=1 Tax=Characodon lateralis TaxID=208331 RepID=A0ABU7D645_9TELE|nr:hypothetical protein [Characodon lateralis]